MDSTDRKVQALVYEGVAAAYGRPRPHLDHPDAPCVVCEHRQAEHAGEDWDGPCAVEGCLCRRFTHRHEEE